MEACVNNLWWWQVATLWLLGAPDQQRATDAKAPKAQIRSSADDAATKPLGLPSTWKHNILLFFLSNSGFLGNGKSGINRGNGPIGGRHCATPSH